MLGGEGLAESAKGARVAFPSTPNSPDGTATKDKIEVTPGPFPAEGIHRVVCGYWLIKAKDLDEAIELVKKAPLQGGEVEIRRVHGTFIWEPLLPLLHVCHIRQSYCMSKDSS